MDLKMKSKILLVLFVALSMLGGKAVAQATRITLKVTDVTIEDFLKSIEERSEYRFFYSANIDVEQKISGDFTDEPVGSILDQAFKGTGIRYEIKERQIILYPARDEGTSQEARSISGKVTDNFGNPLLSVTVYVKGTTNGTITDNEGAYSLNNVLPGDTLNFSFIGLKTREVKVSDNTTIDVVMEEESIGIEEVVAVGYGTQKKVTVSGSVTSVVGSELTKSPAMNVSNSLAGSLPGLVAVGQSGEPGNDYSTLFIRGRSTLNDNSPLIVVDGIPNRSIERIDPSTIESITILKDASGAIYGSQAANGVILVTTKRGKEGKYSVTVNQTTGWSKPTRLPALTNSAEYATLVDEVDGYAGRNPTYTQEEIANYRTGDDPWHYPNTDWFDEVLKPWSLESQTNVSFSGGNENLRSFVSVSSRYQDGFFVNSASNYRQHDLRSNIDKKVNEHIDISLDASFRMENTDFPTASSSTIFRNLMTALPMQPAIWPTGEPGPPLSPSNPTNPVVQATPDAGLNQRENYVFNVNSKINIKIPGIEGLTLTSTGSLDRSLNYTKNFSKRYSLYDLYPDSTDVSGNPLLVSSKYGRSDLTQKLGKNGQYLINSYLTYQKKIKVNHDVNLVAGVEFIQNNYTWFSATRKNFSQNYPEELNFGDPNEQYAAGSNPGTNRWKNYFGRANYSYKHKYIAEFVWRYQGSSKFHPDTRWGFFPGFSAAYRISEEDFWQSSNLLNNISDLKLRASYGKTGNDLIPPYQFFSLYDLYWQSFVTGNDVYHSVYFESLAGNPKSQWEEADQFDLGFDLSVLQSKVKITADYFNNLRSKILIAQTASVPEMTGTSDKLPKVNLGKVRNKGIDFDIVWHDTRGRLNFSVGLNGVYAQNKVLFFDEAQGVLPWQRQTGYPMQSGLYFIATGIYQTQGDLDTYPHFDEARPGDVIFEDVNGDGVINGDDKKRIHKNVVPTLTGGLTATLNYRNFDLSVLFQGQAGAVRYVQYLGGAGEQNYFKTFYDNRWTESNPQAEFPRTFNRNDEYWVSSGNSNTFWLRSTDFIRLKNIDFGYTIPNSLSNRIGCSDVRIKIGGMNLFTFSPDMTDFDPELEPKGDGFAGQGYPLQKIITTGLTVKF